MKERITICFNKTNLIKTLEDYYRQKNDDYNITVEIKTGIKYVGLWEEKTPDVKVIMKSKIQVGNHEAEIEDELTEDEIKQALSESLNNNEFDVVNIQYNARVEYADRPWSREETVFDGLTIVLKRKQLQKVL